MSLPSMSTPTPLILGSVCGPIFGIFDLTKVQRDTSCHLRRLEEVPLGLIQISQVMMIFRPDQLRSHLENRECTNDLCPFAGINVSDVPEVDFICRAWLPNEYGNSGDWSEASISFGGAMVAAEYLRRQCHGASNSFNFAFWSRLTRTWEKLSVDTGQEENMRPDGENCVQVVFDRRDFSPPENILYSVSNCADYGLEEEAIKVQTIYNHALSSLASQAEHLFSVTVFEGPDLFKEAKNLPSYPQLVSFIPIFVGELHHVVVTGDFLRRTIIRKYKKELESESLRPYSNLMLNTLRGENPQKVLEYFPIQQQFEDRAQYPMESIRCGWTFFRDISENSTDYAVSGFPRRFFTLEPGSPGLPPFGNSASGALACAVVQSLLYSCPESERYSFRGETKDGTKPWGERLNRWNYGLEQKRLSIWKDAGGKWVIHGPVRLYGYFGQWH